MVINIKLKFLSNQNEKAIPMKISKSIKQKFLDLSKLLVVVMKNFSDQFNNGHTSKRYSLLQSFHLHMNDTKKSNTSYIDTAAESSIDYKESLSGIIQEERADWKKIKRNSEMIDCRGLDLKHFRNYESNMMSSVDNPSLYPLTKKADHERSRSNILQSTKPMIIEEQKENQIKQSLKSIVKETKSEQSQVSISFQQFNNQVSILPLISVNNQPHNIEEHPNSQQKTLKIETEKSMIIESPSTTKVDLNVPTRKNPCLKKKTTTRRESSQLEAQQEQFISIKSKKVIFKPHENCLPSLPVQKPQMLPKLNGQIKKSKKQNIKNKIGDSITSIASKIKSDSKMNNKSKKIQIVINQPSIKSSKTLHDLGGNNFVHRIKCKDKNMKQRALLQICIQNKDYQQRQMQIHHKIKQLNHPNVLKVYQIIKNIDQRQQKPILCQTIDFYPYNLQQYISDPEREDYSHEQKQLQRKIILFQIIKGLHHFHRNNIYHRNLNPSSILLNERLQVVIFNFSSIDYPDVKNKAPLYCKWLIRPPQIILQPNYIYGSAGDIWQLGCLAVYLLKHKMPFIEYSDSNLIIQMIKCMGPVTREDQNAIGFRNTSAFLFPKLRKQSMERAFKCQQYELLELLKKIFLFNPNRRETAIDLLKNDYFSDLRKQSFKKQYGKNYSLQALFSFPEGQLSQQQKKVIVPSWFY